MSENIPVIAIDGPSGSGKGTLTQLLAKQLNWHLLDSGALYRILALEVKNQKILLTDIPKLVALVSHLNIRFTASDHHEPVRVWLNNQEVTQQVRAEETGKWASKIAILPEVRQALLELQRNFRRKPGLVADGRDMGTVVFPDALLKVFLMASPEERAKRREKQLLAQNIDDKLANLVEDLIARDTRDAERATSPMKPAEDAVVIDTTHLSIEAVRDQVWKLVQSKLSQ